MRIGIDARWIFPKISGIGAYSRRLIENLARIDKENQYFIFSNNPGLIEKYKLVSKPNFSLVEFSHSANSPVNQFLLPPQCQRLGLEVYHSPHFFTSTRLSSKLVVTIHDLIPLCFPHFTPRAKKVKFLRLFKYILQRVSRKADKIITISEHSKKDLVDALQVREDKIEVIYNGVSSVYRPIPSESVRKRLGGVIPESSQVFLFVGRFDPYKNIVGLIKSFNDLKQEGDPELKLVIVGEEDTRYPEAPRLVKDLGLEKEVILTGYLEEEELVYWYNRAAAFILPTFYEGFGLPIVEAFACGCPVITSNVASVPEVAGDAAMLIEPGSQTALTEAMRRILRDAPFKENLRQKGLARAQLFSWEKTAKGVLEVYKRLAK
ncbi:MAG: glycosyltransferase family 1 protein [Candidatus Ratteibacteria bacterium]|nr:glycosyltransferase family 1 protein [Candidatus Ratteibacteria bacterium]